MKVYFVSLGCPKNLTDTEVLMGQFAQGGYSITLDPSEADTIVVNTCAFLKEARAEAEQVIKEMAVWKKKGRCKQLFVAGCLPEYLKGDGYRVKGIEGRQIGNNIFFRLYPSPCALPYLFPLLRIPYRPSRIV